MKTKSCSCGITWEARFYSVCPCCRWNASAVKSILAIIRNFNTRIDEAA
jgi:hypothetical protein